MFSMEGWHVACAVVHLSALNPRMLDLSDASVSSSNFGTFTGLAYLEWHAARDIASLPSTLVSLNLKDSRELTGLPESLGALTRLQQLDLSGCLVSGQRCQSRWAR